LEKPDLYVVARFLDILYEQGSPMKKTNIQMRLGTNYPRFAEYLEWLISKGFVMRHEEMIENSEAYRLSENGVEAYHRIVDWIRETMEGIRL
jgi:predicted transcriptional regulator